MKEELVKFKELIKEYNRLFDTFSNKRALFNTQVHDEVTASVQIEIEDDKGIYYIIERSVSALRLEDENWDSDSAWQVRPNILKVSFDSVTGTKVLNDLLAEDKINELFLKTDEIFMSKDISKLSEADVIEDTIDNMRKKLIDDHMDRLKRKECSPQNSGVYVNLVNNLERAADHMIYIAYSVKDAKEQALNNK